MVCCSFRDMAASSSAVAGVHFCFNVLPAVITILDTLFGHEPRVPTTMAASITKPSRTKSPRVAPDVNPGVNHGLESPDMVEIR